MYKLASSRGSISDYRETLIFNRKDAPFVPFSLSVLERFRPPLLHCDKFSMRGRIFVFIKQLTYARIFVFIKQLIVRTHFHHRDRHAFILLTLYNDMKKIIHASHNSNKIQIYHSITS